MVTKLRSIYYNSNTIGTVTESKQIIKSVNSLWLWHGHFHHQKSEICYLFHWKRNPGGSEELIFGCLKYLAWVWFKITESKSLNLLQLKQHLKRVIQITLDSILIQGTWLGRTIWLIKSISFQATEERFTRERFSPKLDFHWVEHLGSWKKRWPGLSLLSVKEMEVNSSLRICLQVLHYPGMGYPSVSC